MTRCLDSDWKLSAKGNHWRKLGNVVLVVGCKRGGDEFWVLVDGKFLPDNYDSLPKAKMAAETEVK